MLISWSQKHFAKSRSTMSFWLAWYLYLSFHLICTCLSSHLICKPSLWTWRYLAHLQSSTASQPGPHHCGSKLPRWPRPESHLVRTPRRSWQSLQDDWRAYPRRARQCSGHYPEGRKLLLEKLIEVSWSLLCSLLWSDMPVLSWMRISLYGGLCDLGLIQSYRQTYPG